ncbi:ribosomal protein S18-alanine N-acetyltransferase [Bdellovibrionota bacterium FG-1]
MAPENPAAPARTQPNLPGYSLRPVTEDDLAEILRIESAVHRAPWNQENFRAELTKPYAQFWVMTDDETDSVIAGYINFWIMLEECHILNVATDLSFRRRGLAKLMVRRAVDEAQQKDIKKVLLEVRKSNAAAIALYQGLGFSITHVRKSFYSDGEDAYQMALFIDENELIQF